MAKSLKYSIVFLAIISIGFAQYKSEVQSGNNLMNNPAQDSKSLLSLFDPSRFNMNHSFGMSMMNMGGQSIGIASYTNNMNFSLRDNLRLQTHLTFMQPKMMSSELATPYSNTQMYFDAVLDYNPTPNTHFQMSFGNYPQYSRYSTSPFLLNRGY